MTSPRLREPRWPRWSAVVEHWSSRGVPGVEIVSFPPERDWMGPCDKKVRYPGSGHPIPVTNPEAGTARMLVLDYPRMHPEVKVAFKLEAFARAYDVSEFRGHRCGVYRRHKIAEYGWWTPNSKYVLPSGVGFHPGLPRTAYEQAKRWREVVDHAAEAWRALAADWVVVRVPDLMDPGSDEYQAFSQRIQREREHRDRAEYERLRAKYG